ncbi:ubiquinone biosynthesis protein COQ9, mitochondrial precursor [Pyronema domesticum]|uniref:Ubiquinone biosynthesis protein n=1 Tax=Pyronema omphalodes (strain CBS 100304) TaxID=1076935 RepID=U4LGZ7_PYROM|nr:ubiquinone biosynthesis protein COQ9, mitochondrial precursor [Pyronema domesticum]CCX15588.1 Similar to Ubiquinone biosynthesis protein coq9, mitochondrial; acc. no. O13850 [Pyronema omphalodes CBS 100304]
MAALLPRLVRQSTRQCARLPILTQTRTFTSTERAAPSVYTPLESALLSSALSHVPEHGFTSHSLALGARENGYLDISINLFPKGTFDLVRYHLVQERMALKDKVDLSAAEQAGRKLGMTEKIRSLVKERLRGNEKLGGRWQEALAIMSLAENVPSSISELAALSDEIWYLAGDKSSDSSWYTKRAMVAGVYASTEVFMTTDKSPDYRETWEFLDRRLEDCATIGKLAGEVGPYMGFTASAVFNILRSKNVRLW